MEMAGLGSHQPEEAFLIAVGPQLPWWLPPEGLGESLLKASLQSFSLALAMILWVIPYPEVSIFMLMLPRLDPMSLFPITSNCVTLSNC